MRKRILVLLVAFLLTLQTNLSIAATSEANGILNTLKNAVIKDVTNTVQSTVNTAATRAMNLIKLAQYKQQLQTKKQELEDLEASNKNFIIKFFQRRKINREIKDLESKIKELEN